MPNNIERERHSVAEKHFENYDFGSPVAWFAGWEHDEREYVRKVYIENRDTGKDKLVSFHIRFKDNAEADSVYALSAESGEEIGHKKS